MLTSVTEVPANSKAMKSDLLSRIRFDAVLFDLNGVLTATVKIYPLVVGGGWLLPVLNLPSPANAHIHQQTIPAHR